MNNTRRRACDARDLLEQANHEARCGNTARSLELFERCVKEYLARRHGFRAIAVARRAKSVLGGVPKVRALMIKTFRAIGLEGDAASELKAAAMALKKGDHMFFSALDDEAFIEILSLAEPATYNKGRIVMRRGEPGSDVFTIIDGACEVTRDNKVLSILRQGDVFGEIAFFGHALRSATVKTLEKTEMLRLPSKPLEHALARHPCLAKAIEDIYNERIIKKTAEDLEDLCSLDEPPKPIATLRFKKGQQIPANPQGSIAIVKHGVVEVDYDTLCLKTKRYYKPGSVIERIRSSAKAGTDVVIVLASAGKPKGTGDREGS